MTHHVGAHRIPLDVAGAGRHVVLGLQQAGAKPPFPERPLRW
jgi:hypothetical protein